MFFKKWRWMVGWLMSSWDKVSRFPRNRSVPKEWAKGLPSEQDLDTIAAPLLATGFYCPHCKWVMMAIKSDFNSPYVVCGNPVCNGYNIKYDIPIFILKKFSKNKS